MKFREVRTSADQRDMIVQCLIKGDLTSGAWASVVESGMMIVADSGYAIAVSSGTMALKIALHAQGIGKGSKVIIPDVTFVACRAVVNELGASVVFCDVDRETFLLDRQCCEDLVKEGADAIMAVRLGGEPLPEWIFGLGVPVIIDSAHSVDPHDERAVATCYSFHPSKIISGIDGGCIATDREYVYNAAIELRSFGFSKGTRIAPRDGYKANMTNISAVVIHYNICNLDIILSHRVSLRDLYNSELGLSNHGLGMYMVLVDDPDEVCRTTPAIRHYPMPLSEMIFGKRALFNDNAKFVCDHLVSLPFHEYMTGDDVLSVCAIIKSRLIKSK